MTKEVQIEGRRGLSVMASLGSGLETAEEGKVIKRPSSNLQSGTLFEGIA